MLYENPVHKIKNTYHYVLYDFFDNQIVLSAHLLHELTLNAAFSGILSSLAQFNFTNQPENQSTFMITTKFSSSPIVLLISHSPYVAFRYARRKNCS